MGSMNPPSDIERTPRPGGGIEERMNLIGNKVQVLGDEVARGDSSEDDDDGSELVLGRPAPDEQTPLLGGKAKHGGAHGEMVGKARRTVDGWIDGALRKAKGVVVTKEDVVETAQEAVAAIPAVILGCVASASTSRLGLIFVPSQNPHEHPRRSLVRHECAPSKRAPLESGAHVSNLAVMFPTNLPLFADFGGIGVSMFFVSCVVSQLVYTGGGSIFKGGNGSMMIEVVVRASQLFTLHITNLALEQPFYHVIVGIISASTADDKSVVATTMVAFALSSILTGIAFYSLGAMKLGSLSEFFPRHILVGCIGGVGAFLFITGCVCVVRLRSAS